MDIRYNNYHTQLIVSVQTLNHGLLGCDMIDYNKGFSTCRIRVNKRPMLTITQTDLVDLQKLT